MGSYTDPPEAVARFCCLWLSRWFCCGLLFFHSSFSSSFSFTFFIFFFSSFSSSFSFTLHFLLLFIFSPFSFTLHFLPLFIFFIFFFYSTFSSTLHFLLQTMGSAGSAAGSRLLLRFISLRPCSSCPCSSLRPCSLMLLCSFPSWLLSQTMLFIFFIFLSSFTVGALLSANIDTG
jgi:hypothetical protein